MQNDLAVGTPPAIGGMVTKLSLRNDSLPTANRGIAGIGQHEPPRLLLPDPVEVPP